MKVFFDTNVLISVFTSRGLCHDLFNLIVNEHDVVTSEGVLAELHRVLCEKFTASADQADRTVGVMRRGQVVSTMVELPEIPVRDRDDAAVLASAIASGADVLVTGDRDLLDVAGSVSSIRIVDPRTLWEMLKQELRPQG